MNKILHTVPKEIFEVLSQCAALPDDNAKVLFLRNNYSKGLEGYIRGTFDNDINWDLPEDMQYSPSTDWSYPTSLRKVDNMIAMSASGTNTLTTRTRMMKNIMEGIHPTDALLLINMMNKSFPYDISHDVLKRVFPQVIKD